MGLVTLPELISIMDTEVVVLLVVLVVEESKPQPPETSSADAASLEAEEEEEDLPRATTRPLLGDSVDTLLVAVPDGVGGGSLGWLGEGEEEEEEEEWEGTGEEEGEEVGVRCQSGLSAW